MFATYGATVVSGMDRRGELDRDSQYGVFPIFGKQNPVIIEVDSDNPCISLRQSRKTALYVFPPFVQPRRGVVNETHVSPRSGPESQVVEGLGAIQHAAGRSTVVSTKRRGRVAFGRTRFVTCLRLELSVFVSCQ